MKRCSLSLIIREMQNKPQKDIKSHLSEWLSAKNQQTKVLAKMWRKSNPPALLVGMQIGTVTVESSMEPQIIKNGTAL